MSPDSSTCHNSLNNRACRVRELIPSDCNSPASMRNLEHSCLHRAHFRSSTKVKGWLGVGTPTSVHRRLGSEDRPPATQNRNKTVGSPIVRRSSSMAPRCMDRRRRKPLRADRCIRSNNRDCYRWLPRTPQMAVRRCARVPRVTVNSGREASRGGRDDLRRRADGSRRRGRAPSTGKLRTERRTATRRRRTCDVSRTSEGWQRGKPRFPI